MPSQGTHARSGKLGGITGFGIAITALRPVCPGAENTRVANRKVTMNRRMVFLGMTVVVMGVALGGLAAGWWSGGHETVAEAAASRLPDDVPAFFRRGGKELAHFSVDPDRWKNREMNFLRRAEESNHYLDFEDLDGKTLPGTNRYDAMKLIYTDLKKDPTRVGMLPYAIMEYYEKLTVGFYDYR